MSTMIRDITPQHTPVAGRKPVAVLLLGHAAEHTRRADRALATIIRAAQHAGIDWDTILAETGMDSGQAQACLDRWAGDVS